MSKMGELAMEIEELYVRGHNKLTIATLLNIPVELVDGFVASFTKESVNEKQPRNNQNLKHMESL